MAAGNRKPMSYAGAGVDIDAGERVVQLIERHMKSTYGPRVLGRHGAFAGMLRLDYNEKLFARNYRDPVLVSCTDGVGTKIKLAIQMDRHTTIGQDCVAMNVNDMIVQGAEPLLFLDYLGVHKVIPQRIAQVVEGVAEGCRSAGCALIGGETAEMPDIYQKDDYDLAGFSVGVCELNKLIDGARCAAGDVILGLASSGAHSNGYTLVRAIVKQARLDLDKCYDELGTDQPLGNVLLEPTRIYARQIVSLLRKYKVKRPIGAMAHITGGGLPGNVNRVLPGDLNARIDTKAWKPPAVFGFLQRHGRVEREEMFRVFNMGIGYVCMVRPHFAEAVVAKLRRMGETVHVLGKLTRGTGRVMLKG